jgi:hypothetical protein
MLPPSESLQHQNLKLAEFIAAIQIAQPPPPAYSAVSLSAPALPDDHLEYDDDDDDYPSTRPAPITININAALKVEGDSNTIVLPSGTPPPASPSSPQRALQNGRVERLTGMILTALKDAGLFDNAKDFNDAFARRPIKVQVDASIVLKGSKNTICAGMPNSVKAATTGTTKEKTGMKRQEGGIAQGNRKRRACSVSVP